VTEIEKRLSAIEILSSLKRSRKYSELESIFSLPTSVLCRYVTRRVLPSLDRAEHIIQLFKERFLIEEVNRRITIHDGFAKMVDILYDTQLLKLIAAVVSDEYSGTDVTKVLTIEVNGVPMAIQVANEFGAAALIVKKTKSIGVSAFIEEKLIRESARVESLYLPKYSIKPSDKVLLVDDVIRSGKTQLSLARIASSGGASIVGVFSILAHRKGRINVEQILKCPVKSLIELR
jgi:adenine/guanine phosphoribosyltransferase-like PRPP-binding protein